MAGIPLAPPVATNSRASSYALPRLNRNTAPASSTVRKSGGRSSTGTSSHNSSCLPKRDFVTLTPTIGVEPIPNGGENVTTSPEEYRARSRQRAARLRVPCWRDGTSAACRRLVNVTRLVVELDDDDDDDAARRLAERAEREGIEPSALAQRLLSEASEVDPFEFIGSFSSDAVRARDADEFLDREGFGAP